MCAINAVLLFFVGPNSESDHTTKWLDNKMTVTRIKYLILSLLFSVFMSTSQNLYGDYFFEGVLAQMRPVTCQEISIGQFLLKPGEDFLQAVDCFGLKKVLESSII